ncbi:MAG: hypothetical protein JRC77_06045 [Deltaproteobacteria bacterium]|nr:hypothetical protein [Deltaproteobacteria bacterium]
MTTPQKTGIPLVFKIMAGLMLFVALFIAMAVSFYRDCEECHKYASIFMGVFDEMQTAMVAPGTKEMRKLGCDQAMAIDMGKFAKFTEAFEEDIESEGPNEELSGITMVFCQYGSLFDSDGPVCDEVVHAYISGANPLIEDELAVMVQHSNAEEPECAAFYSGDGEYLRPFDE